MLCQFFSVVPTLWAANYLQADETPIPVLESNHANSTHRGYYWVYHHPVRRLVCFDYHPSRSREGPRRFLEKFSGKIQTDGYEVYNNLILGKYLAMLACMAHARRKFKHATGEDPARAEAALKMFGSLYAIEERARESGMSHAERQRLRNLESGPILETLHAWLKCNLGEVTPKSLTGKAITYTLNLWPRLVYYLQDGRYEIDNNLIENTIRPVALGRKNYLFAGSHQAAQNAAMMYSFLGTCKLNDIEPYEWLKSTLEKIPDHPVNRLQELLPLPS